MGMQASLRQLMETRTTLSQAEAFAMMEAVLAGEASEIELAAMAGALGARGATAAELAGFAEAMRAAARPLPLNPEERAVLVDTCGTGGDASGSFNISTAAALVAAGAGAVVAKHGNRAVTSLCGSADVLDALGIPTHLTAERAAEALRSVGFCFLLALTHHPAMRAVMPVRRALGVRTVFHVLGPLLNPAGAARQVMGVYDARLVAPVAEAMCLLGTRHALVVHGAGGLDELSLSGPTTVAEVRDGRMTMGQILPEELGLTPAAPESLTGGDARENARILEGIFAGEDEPGVVRARRQVVLLNAAAVLFVANRAGSLREGLEQAQQAIGRGAVRALIERLRALAHT